MEVLKHAETGCKPKDKKCDTENRISLYHGQHGGCHSADEQLLNTGLSFPSTRSAFFPFVYSLYE